MGKGKIVNAVCEKAENSSGNAVITKVANYLQLQNRINYCSYEKESRSR